MANVMDVAKYFITRSVMDEEPISNLKLQKLCYYAQGIFSALENSQLFEDVIEAWEHGPVVRSVYVEYSKYGKSPIEEEFNISSLELSSDEVKRLEEAYNYFAQYSAWRLREMTHQESPWRNSFVEGEKNPIPFQEIKSFFSDKVRAS